jgi:succinyl-diaminopimelate desuccinylase
MINRARLIKLLRNLIRINSENPPGNEKSISLFVKGYLENLGVTVRTVEFKKGRTNIIAILKGKDSNKSLLITPHLDTVPAGRSWTVDPFKGVVKKGRLYGLGATDCKGNLACALEVMNSLIEDGCRLNYDLIFAATADEETGSDFGLIPLLEKSILKPSAALVLDADDFDIVVNQKGLIHLKVKISGKRAHGAYPWRGANAIDMAVQILARLKSYKFKYKKNRYLAPPTINTGVIRGGDKVNVVADWCEFELDFRFLPGQSAKKILKDLRSIIARHAKKFKIEIQGIQDPYCIDARHALVTALAKSMRSSGVRPRLKGSEGATVITFFQHKNIPAIATGFGHGGCAHTADEFIRVGDLVRGANILERFLKKGVLWIR